MAAESIGVRWLKTAALGARERVRLVLAPAYGVMALVAASGGPHDTLFSMIQTSLPPGAMVWIYLLMGTINLVPWLRLTIARRGPAPIPMRHPART